MNRTCEQMNNLLTAAAVGRFDALRPEQISDLETHLNECGRCAARLMNNVPRADALAAHWPAPAPSAAQWANVWEQIDAAAVLTTRQSHPTMRGGVLRLWRAAAAVAACVALVGFWRFVSPTAPPPAAFQLARNTEIRELESYGGQTPFVVSMSGQNEASIIWVLDDDEGA